MTSDQDVVVAGAGPAGAVAAWTLARAGLRVLLVEQKNRRAGVGQAGRKIGETLPGAATPLLRDLGLLSLLQDGPHLPCYGHASAWGSDELVTVDLIRDAHGHAWRLDRAAFDRHLREAARQAGALLVTSAVLGAALSSDGRWAVRFRDSDVLRARWLIDATGRRALVARRVGGVIRRRDTGLIALYRWATAGDADTRTLVEAGADGWWYTALLPDRSRVVAYHVDAADARAVLRTPGVWEEKLARTMHVRETLTGSVFISALHATEAGGARLDRFAGSGWLATGDAALSFDPLSSQGIFTALYTGMKAGHTVLDAMAGETCPLEAYTDRLESIRIAYLQHCRSVYQAEERWSNRPFWEQRRKA